MMLIDIDLQNINGNINQTEILISFLNEKRANQYIKCYRKSLKY